MDKTVSPLSSRALPLGTQARVVVVVALVAAGVLGIGWAALRARASQPGEGKESTSEVSNELRLTAAQLATLEINPVTTRSFRSEEITEGRIALNGDTTTQVFSPYSGRVARVMAEPLPSR